MNKTITVPESLDDITVGQRQDIELLINNEDLKGDELDSEIIKIILGFDDVEAISVKDRKSLLKDIGLALKRDGEFKQVFNLNGVDFGMIPNFDKISNGEYNDLIKYDLDISNLNKFLAVAYRPIIKYDKLNNYIISEYEGTSYYSELMKDLPMSIANGVKVFFYSLLNDLRNHITMSMEEELVKV